ncbi:cell division protein FtsL [Megamonas hypermegale]|jgi:cell division protein FtsL|uniref:Cell division protein FtsL n=1 Tax=Megamonas hypermegale TaxID=158847 RepID=A0A239TPN5_9FIRM|nr:cell division protein FtsL [Megamonas hypermegale]MBM6760006.1 cell division protein FtsL [Megamonas hypermegale]OUO41412.1 cell division protein FtsL [Megamonas hypermegale]SNU99515.1 Protein required for the initiation of cell division [Megamonas hypermegale]HJG07969.1 cell division protein FtsL [Megamonas hypermegale]
MLAQRKESEWENVQALPKKNKIRKTVKQRRQEKNLNNALRTRCMILFAITTIMAVFFILRSGVAASEAYQLNQMKRQATVLETENSRLHLEIAHLKSPERIQQIAQQELGMILPDKFFFSNTSN